ncbi:MAG: hypothetical protein PHI70_05720 [Proteiniphilum sp.]|nr:hypothetical protein [Proteiniphilum sp.]MDD4416263.1 hypothetical protein [Proteiniphilum sp.]
MKKIITALAIMMISVTLMAQADFRQFTVDIISYSSPYGNDQVVELYEYHYGVPRNTMLELYGSFGNNWGNVLLGLEFSSFLGVPVRDIVSHYHRYPQGNGWGVLAQSYGIKPGSAGFHRMKNMMRDKNRYWRNIFYDYGRYRDPVIARRSGVIFDNGVVICGPVSNKEMKKINKQIEKRNKEIYKQEKKAMKEWEKRDKKIRQQNEKWRKEDEKRIKKMNKW